MTDFEPHENILISEKYTSLVNIIGDENLNKIVPVERKSMIGTKEFIERLGGNTTYKSDEVLPKNCRYISFLPPSKDRLIVIEQPPTVRTISAQINIDFFLEKLKQEGKLEMYGYKDYKKETVSRFTLSFPYIILIIHLRENLLFSSCKVFYRTAPLTSIDDFLLRCNLLNVSDYNQMCISRWEGSEVRNSLGNMNSIDISLSERVDQILDRIWSNVFNQDYYFSHIQYRDCPYIGNLLEWEYYSKIDPMIVFKVPWIKHERTLDQELGTYRGSLNDDSRDFSTRWLKDVIHGDYTNKGYTQRTMTESIYLNNRFEKFDENSTKTLCVGDVVYLGKEKYYVSAFKFPGGTDNPTNNPNEVELEDKEGNKKDHKLTPTFVINILKSMQRPEVTEVVAKNGKTIKENDYIVFKQDGFEKLLYVEKVRKSRDGFTEVRTENSTYLVDFTNFDIVDQDNIVLHNVKLVKGTNYIIKHSSLDLSSKMFLGSKCRFNGLEKEQLSFTREFDSKPIQVNAAVNLSSIVTECNENLIPLPLVRIGNRLFISEGENQIFMIPDRRIMTFESFQGVSSSVGRQGQDTINKLLIGGTRFFLPSCDIDIDLSIGDDVVVSTWSVPQEILKIRTIVGFTLNGKIISVVTRVYGDERTELSSPLVNLSLGTVSAGCVRKVSRTSNGLKVGMEGRAKVKVPGFFKSKSFRICAFITDSEVPLVLCSNFKTFWLTEANTALFEFKEDPTSEAILFNPKITPQLGDIYSIHRYYDQNIYEVHHYGYYNGRRTFRREKWWKEVQWEKYNTTDITPLATTTTGAKYSYFGFPTQRTNKTTQRIPDLFSWFLEDGTEFSRDIL